MRVHLSALGCRLNEAELERWASEFSRHGYAIARCAETADILVLNTCAVTRAAMRKSRQRINKLKRSNPRARLVVSGCYSELESSTALADLGIDLVVANSQKDALVKMTTEAYQHPGMPQSATLPAESALFERNRHRAFIKIQDGCRYKCTFCIVTVARGEERSRPIADLVKEVNDLADQGIQEIVLTGVHVGGYGSDLNTDLACLVEALLQDTDMPRIRFASVEPWDLSERFLELFTNSRVQPHMHLPVQSGSDSVLKRMARRCKTSTYAELTRQLRSIVPEFNVTTDIITGFPGETEQEWQETLAFVETQAFGHIHVFTYSEREGTAASRMRDPVPHQIRQQRSRTLQTLADTLKQKQLSRQLGQETEVLWERGNIQYDGQNDGTPARRFSGYTPNFHRVSIVSDADLENSVLPTRLTGLGDGHLIGQVATGKSD